MGRLVLCIIGLAVMLPAIASAQASPPADKLGSPGCLPRKEANELVAAQRGIVVMQLDGAAIFDTGRYVELDSKETYIPFFLVLYHHGDMFRWSLLRYPVPKNQDPPERCVALSGEARGKVADARPSKAGLENSLGAFLPGPALEHCRKIRPVVDGLFTRQLVRVAGTVMTWLDRQRARGRVLGESEKEMQRKDDQSLKDAEGTGDARCNSLDAQLTRLTNDWNCRIVAQLVGTEFFANNTRDNGAFSFLFCKSSPSDRETWEILKTYPTGATFKWASGQGIELNPDYFVRAFDKK